VVLEVCLSDISGYEVCRSLREEFGDELPIIFVSAARTESFDRVAGLLVGADDYLPKPFAADALLARVRRLGRQAATPPETTSSLTKRELEVLRWLAEGLSQSEIADRMFISEKTIETHIHHILTKLGARNRAQAVALAYRNNFVSVP
jgi:DNA-binding NarL/FixJ family response regulator